MTRFSALFMSLSTRAPSTLIRPVIHSTRRVSDEGSGKIKSDRDVEESFTSLADIFLHLFIQGKIYILKGSGEALYH